MFVRACVNTFAVFRLLLYYHLNMNKLTTWAFARLLTAFLLTFSFSQAGLSQDFSIRTNLLWDAVSEPNIGLEFPLSDNWSIGGNAGLKSWPRWQHWRLEVEAGAAIGLAAYDRYDCKHCGTKVGEERIPAVVPKLALNVAYNPVARDKRKSRSKGSYVIPARIPLRL